MNERRFLISFRVTEADSDFQAISELRKVMYHFLGIYSRKNLTHLKF
jgi:hypothetical protein